MLADSDPHHMRPDSLQPHAVADTSQPEAAAARPRRHRLNLDGTWLPWILAGSFVIVLWVNAGVGISDITRFAGYWVLAVALPGVLIFTAICPRPLFFAEYVAVGAATGVAAESVAFVLSNAVGLDSLTPWWWLAPYLLVFSRQQRERLASAPVYPAPRRWSWLISGAAALTALTMVDSTRATQLPPGPSAPYVDDLFHLSIIHELLRDGPATIPQVSGEPLYYHVFAHAHVANASAVTGLSPDLLFFRLWMTPVAVLSVVLIAALGRAVARTWWSGPLAVWVSCFALGGNYLWIDWGLPTATPFTTASPSQILANVIFVSGALGFVWLIRDSARWRQLGWLLLVFVAGVGSKPTVLPLLLGGALLALVARWIVDRVVDRTMVAGVACIVIVQGVWLLVSESVPGKVTLLGTVGNTQLFRDLTQTNVLRATSSGLFHDALDSPRTWAAATIALLWLIAGQATRVAGAGLVFHPRARTDPVAWWLLGATAAGWTGYLALAQSGLSQGYFVVTAIPAGAAATTWLLVCCLGNAPRNLRLLALGSGLAAGALAVVLVRGAMDARSRAAGYGSLESTMLPLILIGIIGMVGWLAWRRFGGAMRRTGLGTALLLASLIGMSLPPALGAIGGTLAESVETPPAVTASTNGYLSRAEQEGMLWLRNVSGEDDVTITNGFCRPLSSSIPNCDARSYIVSGLAGRRVVLEGWAYTPDAQRTHGENGLPVQQQPSPWPERFALSNGVFRTPTEELIEEARSRYAVRWFVGFKRVGSISDELRSLLGQPAFENDDVVIFES